MNKLISKLSEMVTKEDENSSNESIEQFQQLSKNFQQEQNRILMEELEACNRVALVQRKESYDLHWTKLKGELKRPHVFTEMVSYHFPPSNGCFPLLMA